MASTNMRAFSRKYNFKCNLPLHFIPLTTELNTDDYNYELPDHRIALFPMQPRDQSKLLVFNKGKISHRTFQELPTLLPESSILFFNDTRVIPARIRFKKPSGAVIEVFILDPVSPSPLVQLAMEAKERSTWRCTIGNLKNGTMTWFSKRK